MIKPRIVVTGATGKTGSVVVTELLKAGYPVGAMVRREDDRSARLRAQGAEIAVAEMTDVELLRCDRESERALNHVRIVAPVSIWTATIANCVARSRRSRGLHPSPRSGGASMGSATSLSPARRAGTSPVPPRVAPRQESLPENRYDRHHREATRAVSLASRSLLREAWPC